MLLDLWHAFDKSPPVDMATGAAATAVAGTTSYLCYKARTTAGAHVAGSGLALADVFVDSTDVGARKPDPAAYLAAAEALAVPPERIVFLDDTPACVRGADAVGMVGVGVDPFDPGPAFERARKLLGLDPS